METLLLILAVLVTVYFLYKATVGFSEVIYVQSDMDNHKYMIRRGKNKPQSYLKNSANALAEINNRVQKLIIHLKKRYQTDPTKDYFIRKLEANYNPSVLSEAAIDSRYTTFTVDKKDMHICLRTRDQNETLYDVNLLMYVVLHELAHLCNYNKAGFAINGHGVEFLYIFKVLVAEAINIGVYQNTNYAAKPQEYCGIMINSTILPNH
jgi:hypothetical protein